jgi:hypothetical protein
MHFGLGYLTLVVVLIEGNSFFRMSSITNPTPFLVELDFTFAFIYIH